jgi:hypothetical protein
MWQQPINHKLQMDRHAESWGHYGQGLEQEIGRRAGHVTELVLNQCHELPLTLLLPSSAALCCSLLLLSPPLLLQTELLSGGVDVLVATPGRLLGHFEKGSLQLDHTAALVLDEVDVLAGVAVCGGGGGKGGCTGLLAGVGASWQCMWVVGKDGGDGRGDKIR